MMERNCGACYNRGCVHCEPSLRAAASMRSDMERSGWRVYAAAYLQRGVSIDEAFSRADEAMDREALHFSVRR